MQIPDINRFLPANQMASNANNDVKNPLMDVLKLIAGEYNELRLNDKVQLDSNLPDSDKMREVASRQFDLKQLV